jgi:hypothetical protein
MITFVTGKPGDGKSMYGMRLITRSLLETERVIVTNIPIKVPELRAYLCSKGWEGDLNERLVILRHEEVFEFYRFRSGAYVLPPSPDWKAAKEDGGRKLPRPAFIEAMQAQLEEMKKRPEACQPCEYHIDEAHDYFSAREWADTGRGVLWYASKHRHLHDECVFYTQVMANVEKQLRGLASETIRVRNQMRMSWGPFRKAPIFRVYHYYGAPEKTESATPFNQSVMRLDRAGLASTYNSAGALSVHASPEVIKNRAPLPYWALPVAACGLVVVVGAVLAVAPVAAGKWAGKKISGAPVATVAEASGVKVLGTPPASVAVTDPGEIVSTVLPSPTVRGVVARGAQVLVSVERLGWQPIVRIDHETAVLEDGTRVRLADVRAGGSPRLPIPKM